MPDLSQNSYSQQPLGTAEFLRLMKTDQPNLFVLGCLNRHITVHSQQIRAIKLIEALKREYSQLDTQSVAIVGAGFAGLTFAAFALDATTADVSLFDLAPRPLWIQDSCKNRWLHPGIYDWPLPSSLEPRTTLPVLNWRAGPAGTVATQVRAEWEHIAATKERLRCDFEARVEAITPGTGGKLSIRLASGEERESDLVVLAVGFGLEVGTQGRVGYWNDDDSLDDLSPDSSVLICGFGDGGLADVLRLCLPDF